MKGYLGYNKAKKCKICKDDIEIQFNGYKDGHNASPIVKGRCCSTCNDLYVIPKRLEDVIKSFKEGA